MQPLTQLISLWAFITVALFSCIEFQYNATLANETTKKVVDGRSSHGAFKAYFVTPE